MFIVKEPAKQGTFWCVSTTGWIRYGPFKDREAAQYWADRANYITKEG